MNLRPQDEKDKPLPSDNHKYMKHNTTNIGPWKEKEFDGTCVPPKQKKKNKTAAQVPKMQSRVVCWSSLQNKP
jgi:hypothetical protein